jgi:quercetin dioxygenase-like cupin family protein
MSDKYGLKEAEKRGVKLGNIGHRVVLENEYVRVWELILQPGETIDFHIHYHPYLIISLGGGDNHIETIFGDEIKTNEPLGHLVFMEQTRPVHKLTNKADVAYVSRLVELKHITWDLKEEDEPPAKPAPTAMPADVMDAFKEYLVQTDDIDWVEKSLAGLSHKMLWRNEETEASIALIRIEKGSGIPDAHLHSSNQMMYCIKGKYRYIPTGITLTPGAFYCNPKGSVHGPAIADETSIFLEIYDGPHYPERPPWYDNDEDAR